MPSRLGSEEVSFPPELSSALADVRSDSSSTDWALARLSGRALTLVASGEGGAAALSRYLTDDAVFYGLIRRLDQIDGSATVKFVFLSFLGARLPPLERARTSTVKGALSSAFSPFHAEMMRMTEPGEVTDQAVDELLHEMFGSAKAEAAVSDGSIRVGMRRIQMSDKGASIPSTASAFSAAQSLQVPPELLAAVKDVRDDGAEEDWVLARLSADARALAHVDHGAGGAEALAARLTQDAIYYGIVRTKDVIDNSTTIKFAFLSFLGDNLSPMLRAKASTVKGSVSSIFAPFHAELIGLSDPAEVTSRAVDKAVGAVSHGGEVGDAPAGASRADGAAQMVATAIGGRHNATMHKIISAVGAPPRQAQQAAAPEVLTAIAAVRDDKAPEKWVVLGHEDKGVGLRVIASGEDDAIEAVPALMDDSAILYALVRTEHFVDQAIGVRPKVPRFTLLSWVGEPTPPMRKAKLSTLRGGAVELLSPFHDEHLNLSSHEEISNALGKAVASAA